MIKMLLLNENEKARLHSMAQILLNLPYGFGAEVDLTKKPEELKAAHTLIDCSELVEYLYYQIGYKVRDGSYNQYDDSAAIDVAAAEIGDLVFKHKVGSPLSINHVGIVIAKSPLLICEADGYTGKVILKLFENFKNVKPTASQFAGMRRLMAEKVKRI